MTPEPPKGEPRRVPIRVAREVAKANGFKQVILCAWDGERTHIVTYGTTVSDCEQAATGGNKIKEALGWPKDLNAEPSRVTALRSRLRTQRERLEELAALLRQSRAFIADRYWPAPQSVIVEDIDEWLAALDTILKEEG